MGEFIDPETDDWSDGRESVHRQPIRDRSIHNKKRAKNPYTSRKHKNKHFKSFEEEFEAAIRQAKS